jgi:hypothetical protein
MGLSRLTTTHIAIIGAVLAVVIGAAFFFIGPYKTNQNLALLQQRDAAADAELVNRVRNEKDLAKAEQEVAQTKAQFARYEARLMPNPPIDLRDETETGKTKAMINLWRQPYLLGSAARRFAQEQARRHRVQILSPPGAQFSIAGQPTDPSAISPLLLVFPLGEMQVAGSFQNVNNFFRSWNRFQRLVAVDGLQLSTGPVPGGGQTVVGQATLSIYVFPRANPGATGPGVVDPYAAGGAGGGADALPPGYGG